MGIEEPKQEKSGDPNLVKVGLHEFHPEDAESILQTKERLNMMASVASASKTPVEFIDKLLEIGEEGLGTELHIRKTTDGQEAVQMAESYLKYFNGIVGYWRGDWHKNPETAVGPEPGAYDAQLVPTGEMTVATLQRKIAEWKEHNQ